MRPRPGWHNGSRLRYGAAMLAIGLATAGIAGCSGDDAPKSAGSGPTKGIYVNGSSQDEFCTVLDDLKAYLSVDIDAGNGAVLAAINTINDIEPLAPEQTKADWSSLRMVMQAAVDANGADTVGTLSRAEAAEVYGQLSGQVSDSVAEICGFPLS